MGEGASAKRIFAKYDSLKEHALANFELLLLHWGIEYIKVNVYEFDLIAKWRQDGNFGAVRFNTFKGRGSDFAGINLAVLDFSLLGKGFDISDFAGIIPEANTSIGFDIIGLCQKVYGCRSYKDAAERLLIDWQTIKAGGQAKIPDLSFIKRRQEIIDEQSRARVKIAQQMWKYTKNIKVDGSYGGAYLAYRGLTNALLRETNIRYHPKLINKELNKPCPALLFKVSIGPNSELVAIHRIYLADNGLGKANVNEPKMALANIKGAGIWFGTPGDRLHIVEGPENALTIREMGANFVVCTINSTNFHNITIPDYVKTVIICPDPDLAGRTAADKAKQAYGAQQGKSISVIYPPEVIKDGKALDWNDVWRLAK